MEIAASQTIVIEEIVDDIFVPALGHAMEDCLLVEWLVAPEASVAEGDDVAIIETDKSTMELSAPSGGRLGRQRYPAGTRVPVGAVLAYILQAGESEPGEQPSSAPPPGPGVASEPEPEPTPDEARVSSPLTRRRSTSPRARRLAATTPEPAQDPEPSANGADDRYRTAIAASVTRSWTSIPHFAVSRDLPADALLALIGEQRAAGHKVTLTDLLLKAFAVAVAEQLGVDAAPIGLAVATDRGVAIPVLARPGRTPLAELAPLRAAAAARAKAGRASAEDAVEVVATLSNLGAAGVRSFTGIIPFGQRMLLTTGAVTDRVVFADDGIRRQRVLNATVNLDHRHYDGVHGAQLLARLSDLCAAPDRLVA